MFKALFGFYRKSPSTVKPFLVRLSVAARAVARVWIRKVHVGGYDLYLDPSDNASFRYYADRGDYEAHLATALLSFASRNTGAFFLDVGAGYGAYTLRAADLGRYGLFSRVYAFEPDRRCCGALSRSVSANDMEGIVELHNVIVGDRVGEATLIKSGRASTSNRTSMCEAPQGSGTNAERLKCITIESIFEALDVTRHVFIIKIDVEGNELNVLRGMERLLRQSKGFVLLYEYYPSAMRAAGIDPAAMRSFIMSLNLDAAYAELDNGLVPVSVGDGLHDAMAMIDGKHDSRHDSAGNFIVCRGLE